MDISLTVDFHTAASALFSVTANAKQTLAGFYCESQETVHLLLVSADSDCLSKKNKKPIKQDTSYFLNFLTVDQ